MERISCSYLHIKHARSNATLALKNIAMPRFVSYPHSHIRTTKVPYLKSLLRLHLFFSFWPCDVLSPALVVGRSLSTPALVAGRWKLFGLWSVDQRLFAESGVDVFGRSGLSADSIVSGEKCIVWRDLAVSGEKEDSPADVAGREGVVRAEVLWSGSSGVDARSGVEGRFFLRSVRWRILLAALAHSIINDI